MQKNSTQYHVGIDLGTTHTVVAYARIDPKEQNIHLLDIAQLIGPGQVATKPLLPSVRYHPEENELANSDFAFARSEDQCIIGEAARLLGSKSKGRLVTSAKSWLSHTSIDHNAAILPWGSSDGITKVSPVDASASYLNHIRIVWAQKFPEAPMEQQDIVITVPASFDEAARSLTLEAAKIAGLHHVRLLEEPQAVCYDWLRHHVKSIKSDLTGVNLLLVCDIGGGTTDLTLIKVEQTSDQPKLSRIAVGEHLMLGGDNIDLALAHLIEKRFNSGQSQLSTADFSFLIEQCRNAKELLLAENAPGQATITLLGSGSKLIGGAKSTLLTQNEVKNIALDGFFPLTEPDDLPSKKRSGVVEFGLPYAAEPAISKHVAAFLALHKEAAREASQGRSDFPNALLLNGGVFKSTAITQRIVELLKSWHTQPIILLDNQRPEYAVAYGAVSYAIARRDKKIKIESGSARSYFLLIGAEKNQQSKSETQLPLGICLLPKGSAEGEEIILIDRQFSLRTGTPVRFDLVSYSGDKAFKPGEIIEISDEFHTLPPLAIVLDNQLTSREETIVQLAVTQTELGTLKIQCISVNDNLPDSNTNQPENFKNQMRWNVEFQLRKQKTTGQANTSANLPIGFAKAAELIQAVFGPKSKDVDPNAVKNLRANLEKQLGNRTEWDTNLLRNLFAILWEGQKFRRRSPTHERIWFSLTGFCARPGFGWQLDDWRINELWKIYPQALQFSNEIQNWSEWWILWRRVAGGLGATAQEKIFADISNFINPASARQPNIIKLAKQRSYDDIVRLAAVLEHISVSHKEQLGDWLIKRLQKIGESQQTWWALGRVGARVPFYGNVHDVVPEEVVSGWLTYMLAQDWKKTPQIAFAATSISRRTDDRVCDIKPEMRKAIIEKLKSIKTAPLSWLEIIEHHKTLDLSTQNEFFGESLPSGLQLINKTL